MKHANISPVAAGPEVFVLTAGGRKHAFRLTLEPLAAPGGGRLDYWNMDGRALRSAGAGQNGRAVVDFWWDCVRKRGDVDEYDQIHYLLARLHLRFAHQHAVHEVFNAAHLGRCADREHALPPEEVRRLWDELEARGPGFVQGGIEQLFLGHEGKPGARGLPDTGGLPDERELPAFDEALRHWLGNGLVALRQPGVQGLDDWLDQVAKKVRDYQRRGADKQVQSTGGRIPRFINAVQYECLVHFHLCLADVWGHLIPHLQEQRKLDPRSARFMDFMHQVHRPSESECRLGRRRGALCGYPLALHPVGRWMLGRTDHLTAICGWLDRPDHEAHARLETAWECPAYRRLVHAILCAAHECAAARTDDENRGRPVRNARRAAAKSAKHAPGSSGHAARNLLDGSPMLEPGQYQQLTAALERVAARRRIPCPACRTNAPLAFEQVVLPKRQRRTGTQSVPAWYRCTQCRDRVQVPVQFTDFRDALGSLAGHEPSAHPVAGPAA